MQQILGLRCPTCGLSASASTVLTEQTGPVGTAMVQCPLDGTVYQARWRPETAQDLALSERAALLTREGWAAALAGHSRLGAAMRGSARRLERLAQRRGTRTERREVASR